MTFLLLGWTLAEESLVERPLAVWSQRMRNHLSLLMYCNNAWQMFPLLAYSVHTVLLLTVTVPGYKHMEIFIGLSHNKHNKHNPNMFLTIYFVNEQCLHHVWPSCWLVECSLLNLVNYLRSRVGLFLPGESDNILMKSDQQLSEAQCQIRSNTDGDEGKQLNRNLSGGAPSAQYLLLCGPLCARAAV